MTGGESDRGSYFIPKKNHNFRICLPKKITTFFNIPQNIPIPLGFFLRPQKIPASFIDPKESLLAKISDPKKSLGPPSLKYGSGAPGCLKVFIGAQTPPKIWINTSPYDTNKKLITLFYLLIFVCFIFHA